MKIHVCITYDVTEPSLVPGSVVHSVAFDHDIAAHRLVQLAKDTAETVARGFLRHVLPERVRCAEPHASPKSYCACSSPGCDVCHP